MQSQGQSKSHRVSLDYSQWRKGMAGTRPSLLLQFWLRGSGRHGGGSFNTSLTSLERNQEAVAPWPVEFSLGREGTSKPRGFWALSHLFSWFYKTIPALKNGHRDKGMLAVSTY